MLQLNCGTSKQSKIISILLPLDFVGKCFLNSGWSSYFDESKPNKKGEFENLDRIRKRNAGKVCEKPSAIGAKLLSGKPYQYGGEILELDPRQGLSCKSKKQADRRCEDYKVRFCCRSKKFIYQLFYELKT